MEVSETGSYEIEENIVFIYPDEWSGVVKFSTQPEQPISNDGELEDRSYQWAAYGDNLLLYGVCGDFQIDLGCGGNNLFLTGFQKKN
ncbi:MAG: hypothetical protein AAGG59_16395 [Bacteroidota bacterium]